MLIALLHYNLSVGDVDTLGGFANLTSGQVIAVFRFPFSVFRFLYVADAGGNLHTAFLELRVCFLQKRKSV